MPPADAAMGSGSFFGIPHGWPLALAIVALIALMWMARSPMRRVLWQTFFVVARIFGRWGLWLNQHGQAAKLATSEKIIAHRADELADRLLVMEDRIGRRAEKLPQESGPLIAKLDSSAHAIETSANALTGINVDDVAERALRAALPRIEEGRGLTKIEKSTAAAAAKGLHERLAPVRPTLSLLKTEAPRLRATAQKLGDMERRFTQNVESVNKSFADYEDCLRSGDRVAVAGRHSLVIPWIIAVFITAIALSGVFLNFFLIQRPMSEIVGEGARIGGISLPTFAAMILIFLEFVAGVVLMDAAGFTRIIPTFQSMSDTARRIMFWTAFAFLAAFSFLEATLAIVREQIIETEQETRMLASGMLTAPALAAPVAPDAAAPETAATPDAAAAGPAGDDSPQLITLAQIILAVLIPWLLAVAALPLETIVRNSVFLIQIAGAYLMLTGGFVCKTLATALKSIGLFVLAVYDLIIFAPLWVERKVKGLGGGSRDEPPPVSARDERPERADREQSPRRDKAKDGGAKDGGKDQKSQDRELQRA